jgi:hypothetical protein
MKVMTVSLFSWPFSRQGRREFRESRTRLSHQRGSAQIRDELPIARVVAQQIAAGRDQLIDLLVGERKAGWDPIEEAPCLGIRDIPEADLEVVGRDGLAWRRQLPGPTLHASRRSVPGLQRCSGGAAHRSSLRWPPPATAASPAEGRKAGKEGETVMTFITWDVSIVMTVGQASSLACEAGAECLADAGIMPGCVEPVPCRAKLQSPTAASPVPARHSDRKAAAPGYRKY